MAGVVSPEIGHLVVAALGNSADALPTGLLLGVMVAVAALCAVLLLFRVSPRHNSDERLLAADPALSPAALRGYALALIDARRYPEAEDALRLHLSRMPGDSRIRAALGALYSLRGDHASSASELLRASQLLQRESEGIPAHTRPYAALLAVACAVEVEATGDATQAAERMREALALDPGAAAMRQGCMRMIVESARESEWERYIFEGLSAWDVGPVGVRAFGFADGTSAARFYHLALRDRPQDGRLLGDYAQALQATGDYQAADRTFKQATEQSPRDPWIRCDLGLFYWRRDRRADAVRELAEAVQIAPRSAAVHATYGMVLKQDGQLQEAERELMAAATLRPDVWILVRLVGATLVAQGKLPQAARAYREAERLGASDAEFRLEYADVLVRIDQPQAAEEQYRLAVRADSRNGAARARYGAFLLEQLRIEDAEEQLRAALLWPGGEQAHVSMARLCLMERRLDEALVDLKSAMEQGIQTVEVQQYQAEWMLLRGRAPEAYVIAQRLVEQGPPRASLFLLLGGSLLALDRHLEAQAALREAARVDPALPVNLLRQARVLRDRGLVDPALETLAQALAVAPDWPDAVAEQQAIINEQAAAPAGSRRFTHRPRS